MPSFPMPRPISGLKPSTAEPDKEPDLVSYDKKARQLLEIYREPSNLCEDRIGTIFPGERVEYLEAIRTPGKPDV